MEKQTKMVSRKMNNVSALQEEPLVSVAMITYNHKPYIEQAIKGVLRQKTNFPFELIIGEDCSTDGTREIVLSYQHKYPDKIRVVTSDMNVGATENTFRTLDACNRKYMASCEGDDYWHDPHKLQKQIDVLESDSKVGLVHSDVIWHNCTTGKRTVSYCKYHGIHHDHKDILKNMILGKYKVLSCTVVVRNDLLKEIRRSCRYELSERFMMIDFQLWIEVAHRSKVVYIVEPLGTYNELTESASRSNDVRFTIKFEHHSMELMLHYANKYGGANARDMCFEIVSRITQRKLALACRSCDYKSAKEAVGYLKTHHYPVDFVCNLYLLCSRYLFLSYLMRFAAFLRNRWRAITRKPRSLMTSPGDKRRKRRWGLLSTQPMKKFVPSFRKPFPYNKTINY